MSDLQQQLTQKLSAAYDRFESRADHLDSASMDDIKGMVPLRIEMMLTQWGASLDIQVHHEMMKSSIDAIR